MILEKFLSELDSIETLRMSIKDRAMVYQIDAKETAARRDGVPLNSYFDLPYGQWIAVRDQLPPPPY